ncbi:methyltransferase [Moorena producens PAL-8-15-08-1]|uniref:Methyltransferase n=1 Tax=Moorena producens PAL-8-15-08-1 TaxID=1458985 RepID=A0A1D8TYI7_9CYAN|nr:FkbM family methyltransferase [Moorena producens]AOX02603.1 methyltransferase [Moorena producens PAL-8-15-08-1]
MDLEQISRKSLFGQVLRLPLRLIPPEMTMPIWLGKLAGKKWIVGAGRNGCWLGTYEYDNQRVLEKTLKLGNTVFDIGAHAGFFTLLTSVLVGDQGKVFAFEPLPQNLGYLRKHLSINSITNATVMAAALSDRSGMASFRETSGSYQGGISSQGTLQVKMVSLDQLIASGELPVPDCIKIDVEGHEKFVLLGAKSLLESAHPTIFLSIHGRPVYQQCCQLLESLGYKIQVLDKPHGGELPKNLDLIASYPG